MDRQYPSFTVVGDVEFDHLTRLKDDRLHAAGMTIVQEIIRSMAAQGRARRIAGELAKSQEAAPVTRGGSGQAPPSTAQLAWGPASAGTAKELVAARPREASRARDRRTQEEAPLAPMLRQFSMVLSAQQHKVASSKFSAKTTTRQGGVRRSSGADRIVAVCLLGFAGSRPASAID